MGVSYPGPVPSPTPIMQGVTTEELTKLKLQAEIANLTKPIYNLTLVIPLLMA